MNVVLETQRVFGKTIIAAVVRNAFDKYHSAYHLGVTGDRSPLAVLIRTGDQIDAFTPNGDPLTMSQIHQLSPEAVAHLMSKDLS